MLFIAVLFFFLVYLAISVAVIALAARWAKQRNRSPWRWGGAAALGMYLLVFWDHIPTLILHKYYCTTEAGFWVYKTPEQWKKENPGIAETLTRKELPTTFKRLDGTFGYILNARFIYETRQWHHPVLPITISADSVIDTGRNEVMNKRVSVGSGYGSLSVGGGKDSWKFWVHVDSCVPKVNPRKGFENFGGMQRKMGTEPDYAVPL